VSRPRTEITTLDQLFDVVGLPGERAARKVRDCLLDVDCRWLMASPFCVLATADADGRCDASPKGDPAGSLVHIIDDRTIALAERPGNRRVDGYRNIVANPHVGIEFFIPGRGDTLRINGRARLLVDDELSEALAVADKSPQIVLMVEIEQVFFHCAKAFLRSGLWQPDTWAPDMVERRAVIAHDVEPDGRTVAELDEYYCEDNYTRGLY
jgi:PPOX class probable FMN-dependent enzyme